MRSIAVIVLVLFVLAVPDGDAPSAAASLQIELLSRNLSGAPSSGASCHDVSPDGRFVAFTSRDGNIVAGDTNNADDVFLLDRQTGVTSRVNVSNAGGQSAGDTGGCGWPKVNADGRYVAFMSLASDLVEGDTNNHYDMFVRDMEEGKAVRVSVSSEGEAQAGSGMSYPGDISADGRFVVFESGADNLVPDDLPYYDTFIHDRDVDGDGQFDEPGEIATELVSISTSGEPGNGGSRTPVMSDDGTVVAFASEASNLVEVDTVTCPGGSYDYNCYDIFVRDLRAGTTRRVSQNVAGEGGTNDSSQPAISPDGRFVAFASKASNLVSGDAGGWSDVFLYDLEQESIELVNLTTDGGQSGGPGCSSMFWYPCISITEDGGQIAFGSSAPLIAGDTNCSADVYVRNRSAGETRRVSVDGNGDQLNGSSSHPVFGGGALFFMSTASDILPGLPEPTAQVYAVSDTAAPIGGEAGFQPQSTIPGVCLSTEGDVDCDLDVDSVDALLVLKVVASMGPRSDCMLARGNVQCYWQYGIDAVDALDILRYVAGLLEELPNCPPPNGK